MTLVMAPINIARYDQLNMENQLLQINSVTFSFEDISSVITSFYGKVSKDKILRAPFGTVEDWPQHIGRLTHFWWIRFGGKSYQEGLYNPVQKHFESGFNEVFLDRWLEIFRDTLIEELNPDQANLWYSIAEGMGLALTHNNDLMIRYHQQKK